MPVGELALSYGHRCMEYRIGSLLKHAPIQLSNFVHHRPFGRTGLPGTMSEVGSPETENRRYSWRDVTHLQRQKMRSLQCDFFYLQM